MDDVPVHAQLSQLISGYWKSQAIYAAATLGIADLLKDGRRDIDELAQQTGTRNELLYRLLRALASVGIFREGPSRTFSLTPMAELLRSDAEQSQRWLAMMIGDEHYHAWGELVAILRTGENAFEKLYGMPIFDYLSKHPEQGRIFDRAMTGIHGRETDAVLAAYDFSAIGALADIGGGNGLTLIGILQKHPQMRGILFDLPQVIDRARPNFETAGVADRCELISGSFFEAVPPGADAFLMRHIIHDWTDEQSLTILRNCQRAMKEHSRLLVVESVIPPGNDPFMGKFLDLNMMLIPGGKERTADEYRELYTQAGFELTRIVPTSTEVSVVEGRKR
ncbi:MAG TPA: methyltransferase [Pirellulales bacterium]|nr:methyltransferase [Pirellulales bacterium]